MSHKVPNVGIKIPLDELSLRAKRNLKFGTLQDLYSDEELEELLKKPPTKADTFIPAYVLLRQTAKRLGKRRRWSYEEDQFLHDTYQYLTDAVIALALNIPETEVLRHRNNLGLKKVVTESHYVVLHAREGFEEDMKKYQLNKVRGINPRIREVLDANV